LYLSKILHILRNIIFEYIRKTIIYKHYNLEIKTS
jgi:hypothetical protein